MIQERRKLKVLHVLGSLNRGGAETWLVQLMQELRSVVSMDFAVYSDGPYDYSELVEAMGGRVFSCGSPKSILAYVSRLRKIIKEAGPYDVVHSHLNEFSGVALTIAAMQNIPIRIAHSHIERSLGTKSWLRSLSHPLMRNILARVSTQRIGCSAEAAKSIFNATLPGSGPVVVHCGIDLTPFSMPTIPTREEMLLELGIDPKSIIIGHVGRFSEQKNHLKVLEIAQALAPLNQDVKFLLVGRGALEAEIRNEIAVRGLKDRVVLIGIREDVPLLMRQVFDLFLFPSLFEGLAIVLIEAQAAGLQSVISDTISSEATILDDLVSVVPLDASVEEWAETVLGVISLPRSDDAVVRLSKTDFSIEASARSMLEIYRGA